MLQAFLMSPMPCCSTLTPLDVKDRAAAERETGPANVARQHRLPSRLACFAEESTGLRAV